MTQKETYVTIAVVAFFAYHLGRGKSDSMTAAQAATYDPLGWLQNYTPA